MGPLGSIRVLEFAGIGPGPMCAMALSDLGAQVLRLDRPSPAALGIAKPARFDYLLRGRKRLAVDLKSEADIALVLDLVAGADAIIEGFRPGTMERLGLGPDVCLARNPRLVYARMTGWGQTGPLAKSAAHDINYIAISGALDAIGRKGAPPTVPLNLIGDYAGAVYMAMGILAGIVHSRETGQGQVVDTAIADTTAHLMTHAYGMCAAGMTSPERGTNVLDGGVPYYDVYRCRDGTFISIGAIEEKFFHELIVRLGFDPKTFPPQRDVARHAEMRRAFEDRFLQKTREEWCAELEGTDACFAPVLTAAEAASHPHYQARRSFVDVDGLAQPAPVPVFSATPPSVPSAPAEVGFEPASVLQGWLSPEALARLARERPTPAGRNPVHGAT